MNKLHNINQTILNNFKVQEIKHFIYHVDPKVDINIHVFITISNNNNI